MTAAFCLCLLALGRWSTDVAPLWQQQTYPRLLLALLLGICVGAERQWRQRTAGLRTNTLVCLGSAAFVDLGLTVAPNTTQVIAYVVSGVGFLGAGAIMKDGANVRGLNTAATLWCSAAVGACAGAGEILDAVFVACLLIVINSALRPLSRFIDRRSLAALNPYVLYSLRIVGNKEHSGEIESHLTRAIEKRSLALRESRIEEESETNPDWLMQAVVEAGTKDEKVMNKLVAELRTCPWIDTIDVTGLSSDETE